MTVIARYQIYEKLHEKSFYILTALGMAFLFVIASGSASLSINGEAVTGFRTMFPILHTLANALACMFGALISSTTIPKEYERQSSHLVWSRRISEPVYHGGLTLANFAVAGLHALAITLVLVVYVLRNGEGAHIAMMLPIFLFLLLNVAAVVVFTSAMSILVPSTVALVFGLLLSLFGMGHTMLEMVARTIGGFSSTLIRGLLMIVPNFYGVAAQARTIMAGEAASPHVIIATFTFLYLAAFLIYVFRKKEA